MDRFCRFCGQVLDRFCEVLWKVLWTEGFVDEGFVRFCGQTDSVSEIDVRIAPKLCDPRSGIS